MLVLRRREGQDVFVGTDVRLIIGKITGTTVELIWDAPPTVPILRGELLPQGFRPGQGAKSDSKPSSGKDASDAA